MLLGAASPLCRTSSAEASGRPVPDRGADDGRRASCRGWPGSRRR